MNLKEAAQLLGLAAARDNRTPSEAMALAWHEDLGDLDFDVAREALGRHYRTSTDYLMPVHIRRLGEDVVREQRRAIREAREERLAIEAAAETDARPLTDRAPAIQEFVRQQALKFAVPEADRRHQLAVKRAREENGRPEKVQRAKPAKSKRGEQLPDPADASVAALATSYLIDGYEPKDVSERLGISRKWCETTIRKFAPKESR
jgi:hypothetical protein